MPQSAAMRLLGQKIVSMFLRYDVAATEELAQAVAASEEPTNGTRAVHEPVVGAGPEAIGTSRLKLAGGCTKCRSGGTGRRAGLKIP